MSVKVKVITKNKIEERIAQLTAQREQLVQDAQRQIAAHDAAIGELRALLADEPESQESEEPDGAGADD